MVLPRLLSYIRFLLSSHNTAYQLWTYYIGILMVEIYKVIAYIPLHNQIFDNKTKTAA